jgi:hypothetical protein
MRIPVVYADFERDFRMKIFILPAARLAARARREYALGKKYLGTFIFFLTHLGNPAYKKTKGTL